MPGSDETGKATGADRDHPPARERVKGRARTYLVITGLAWLSGGLLIYLLQYAPTAPLQAEGPARKQRLLARQKGVFSSAVFGSSHLDQGFAPLAFDRAMQPEFAVNTLNLAVPGTGIAGERELTSAFAEQLQAPHSATAPCFLLVEVEPESAMERRRVMAKAKPGRTEAAANADNERPAYLARLSYVLRAVPAAIVAHLRYLMRGRKPYTPEEWANRDRGERLPPLLSKEDPLFPRFEALQQNFFAHPPEPRREELPPENLKLLAHLQKAAQGRQLALVDVIYPTQADFLGESDYPEEASVKGELYPVVNLARPELYPSLYDRRNWVDIAHLNYKGSELVTQLFATKLKAWYAKHGAPPACTG